MIVVSLFNGMGTLRQALENLNIKVEKYYSSEIKQYANKLQQYHFPDVIQVGDIRKWKEWGIDWSTVDFIGSGSPCQDLSIAGKRAGLSGNNSSLFWVFIEILNHVKTLNPNVKFLQENVGSAPKEDVRIMSEAMNVLPVRINSNLLTAQNRDRYYWSNVKVRTDWTGYNWTDIPQPKDRKIFLKDIIESGEVDAIKSRCITERYNSSFEYVDDKSIKAQINIQKRVEGGFTTVVKEVIQINNSTESGESQPYQQNRIYDINGIFPAICTSNNGSISNGIYLRKLSQTELERLQGFPDGYTSILSYNQAASVLGDGWTLPVIEHILSYL